MTDNSDNETETPIPDNDERDIWTPSLDNSKFLRIDNDPDHFREIQEIYYEIQNYCQQYGYPLFNHPNGLFLLFRGIK